MVFKMDIFKRLVYLLPLDEQGSGPVPVSVEDMNELVAMNARGEVPGSLSDFAIEEAPKEIDDVYSNVVGQDSLNRFDEKRRRKSRKPKGRSGEGRPRGGTEAPATASPKVEGGAPRTAPGGEQRPKGRSGRNRNRPGRNRGGSGDQSPQPKGE